jgi:hypothetical protein
MASKLDIESVVASLSPADIESVENAWAIGRLDWGNEIAPRDHITQVKRRSEKAIPLLKRMLNDLERLARLHRWEVLDEKTWTLKSEQNFADQFGRYRDFLGVFLMASERATKRKIGRGSPRKDAMLRPMVHSVTKIAARYGIAPTPRGLFNKLLNEIGRQHLPLWSTLDHRTLARVLKK